MRSASNPGGLGHFWVKERFVGTGIGSGDSGLGSVAREGLEPQAPNPESPAVFERQGRLYIPSRIADNLALDQAEYRRSLSHLPPLIRERLMNGDWSVEENGLIRGESFRYYIEKGGQLELLDARGRCFQEVTDGSCFRLITIDPAGTSAERTAEANGRPRSYSVLQVWDRPPRELAKFLLLRHQERKQVGFEGLCRMILDSAARWRPDRIGIEGERLGQAVVDLLKNDLPIETVPTQNKDKATRAARLLWKFERGEVFFPRLETTWRPALEAECLAWTGDKRQVTDQIDAAAYAAILTDDGLPHAIQIGPLVMHA
jgi:predicted phage terminase large subunit-like protein